jgi:hypothetical protein
MRPFALGPGKGTSYENPAGGIITFKTTGDQSDGGLTAIEGGAAPGEGPRLHVHRDQDEFIYTLGEFEEFFIRYAQLPPEERGIEAFGRLAAETNAMEVLGPPLAQSDPL